MKPDDLKAQLKNAEHTNNHYQQTVQQICEEVDNRKIQKKQQEIEKKANPDKFESTKMNI